MLINKKEYEEDYTDSIQNMELFQNNRQQQQKVFDFYTKIRDKYAGKSFVEVFKQVFGKQQSCKTYTNRNWVWTFSDGTNTIWCLVSKEGVNWEYDCRTSEAAALVLMNEVMNTVCGTTETVAEMLARAKTPLKIRDNGEWRIVSKTSSTGPK